MSNTTSHTYMTSRLTRDLVDSALDTRLIESIIETSCMTLHSTLSDYFHHAPSEHLHSSWLRVRLVNVGLLLKS